MGSCSESTAPVFEARRLTKFYGRSRGIEELSMTIRRGEIFGLLGPNGAGKTTLIRTALGLLQPTSGSVLLFGDVVRTHSDLNHEHVGYLPADLRLWPRLTARKISDLLLGIGARSFSRKRRDELAERLSLDLDRRVKNLSLGNRQKVGLILALQHDPKLVILDEPTSGIDPLIRRIVIEILREFAARGGTVIYSSHNLSEVEQISSRAAILRQGRIVALKTIEEVRAERGRQFEFVFGQGSQTPESLPEALHQFEVTKINARTWRVCFHGSPSPLLRWLTQFDIVELSAPQITLEEAFMTYYRGDAGSSPPQSAAGSEGRN